MPLVRCTGLILASMLYNTKTILRDDAHRAPRPTSVELGVEALGRRMPRESNCEHSSLIRRRRGADAATMRGDDLTGDVEAQPNATELPWLLRFGLAADQRVKDRRQRIRRDRRAAVLDHQDNLASIIAHR